MPNLQKLFLRNQKNIPDVLPQELYKLVKKATFLLGEAIRESEGQAFYDSIENYRLFLKETRGTISEESLAVLSNKLKHESATRQFKIAHAFSLQLEIVNTCETAYRTWRQRLKVTNQKLQKKVELKFVLTAHPTEARSTVVVEILERITDLLVDGLQRNFILNESEFSSHLRLLWKLPLSKQKRPSVTDEAEFIFSLVFSKNVFDFFLSEKSSYNLLLSTWVGGDKDGHPGVNAEVMRRCFEISRGYILRALKQKLTTAIKDLALAESVVISMKYEIEVMKRLIKALDSLKSISAGDGNRVKKWKIEFEKMIKGSPAYIYKHYEILLIRRMIKIFPALVMPMELREDSHKINEALHDRGATIRRMLADLRSLTGALNIVYYARGLVISHCENVKDIEDARKLIWNAAKTKILPIIPLFESETALRSGKDILKLWLQNKQHLEQVKLHWSGYMEVMLGYSDSSKEIGVFSSRLLIQRAMLEIESVLQAKKITPIFFHGSGGSVARGGGSLSEQISWWPNSAIEKPKITIQGEMVQRTFATKEILDSQCVHMRDEFVRRKIRKINLKQSPTLYLFSSYIETEYKKNISNPKTLQQYLDASPYRYLDVLKIGSRPIRRPSNGDVSISSLRAIPWILCWTQTRSLWPVWWGVGTAWCKLSDAEKMNLRNEFCNNPFLSSFVKILGYTLAKVELNVWKLYFNKSSSDDFFNRIENEFKLAKEFIFDISGEKTLIWYRPWLEESIRLRAPHVHILNVLQILAMQKNNEALLKETLVGIACGMLTTG